MIVKGELDSLFIFQEARKVFNRKPNKFAVQLNAMAENLERAAKDFEKVNLANGFDFEAYFETIKALETHGDNLMHHLISDLNQTFITPIEREDILALANAIDDVLDGMEEFSAMLTMYNRKNHTEHIDMFVENISKACSEMKIAVELVNERKFNHVRVHVIKVKEYETNCDAVLRKSIKELFDTEEDAIKIIQMKDIYNNLENIADRCQTVAVILESIVMKNS